MDKCHEFLVHFSENMSYQHMVYYQFSYAAIPRFGLMDDLSFVLLTGKQEMRAEEPTK